MANISHFTQTVNGVSTTYDIHDANAVPRSGGAALTGNLIGRVDDTGYLDICSSYGWGSGATLTLFGQSFSYSQGWFNLIASANNVQKKFEGKPDGSLTWDGQPIQYGSDQRLKQQIAEIDDKLLDAWESVELCQFKYNDAVDQKKDKARLHTGYVVQQMDNACKSHNVDVSKYGLYCHEEYPEETREVEQADGTKTIEVVRPASEHYSLRYTEAYAIECKYLRRCIERLTARIEELEKGKEQEASK